MDFLPWVILKVYVSGVLCLCDDNFPTVCKLSMCCRSSVITAVETLLICVLEPICYILLAFCFKRK